MGKKYKIKKTHTRGAGLLARPHGLCCPPLRRCNQGCNGLSGHITKTRLCNIQRFFTAVKMTIFSRNLFTFSYFCSKHRLWVQVRTASSISLCFRAKIRKQCVPLKTPFYYIKVGCKGLYITRTCQQDDNFAFVISVALVLL